LRRNRARQHLPIKVTYIRKINQAKTPESLLRVEHQSILEITFTKLRMMKYISHLDLIRVFSRALRRTQLPCVITQGFTPRIKLRFEKALKVGVESEHEKAYLYFNNDVPAEEVTSALNRTLPEGIRIRDARYTHTEK